MSQVASDMQYHMEENARQHQLYKAQVQLEHQRAAEEAEAQRQREKKFEHDRFISRMKRRREVCYIF